MKLSVSLLQFCSLCVPFLSLLASDPGFAHKGVEHSVPQQSEAVPIVHQDEMLQKINVAYRSGVKASLMKACGDCHSNATEFPWYSDLPIVGKIIRDDITEAKEHLDLSNDFPFKGHGKPIDDLKAIEASLREGSMPPWQYNIMHPRKVLSEHEKHEIFQWIVTSLGILEGNENR